MPPSLNWLSLFDRSTPAEDDRSGDASVDAPTCCPSDKLPAQMKEFITIEVHRLCCSLPVCDLSSGDDDLVVSFAVVSPSSDSSDWTSANSKLC